MIEIMKLIIKITMWCAAILLISCDKTTGAFGQDTEHYMDYGEYAFAQSELTYQISPETSSISIGMLYLREPLYAPNYGWMYIELNEALSSTNAKEYANPTYMLNCTTKKDGVLYGKLPIDASVITEDIMLCYDIAKYENSIYDTYTRNDKPITQIKIYLQYETE